VTSYPGVDILGCGRRWARVLIDQKIPNRLIGISQNKIDRKFIIRLIGISKNDLDNQKCVRAKPGPERLETRWQRGDTECQTRRTKH